MSRRIEEMNDATAAYAVQNITREGDNLRATYFNSLERLIRMLFLLSTGGVVTVLAYIYNIGQGIITWRSIGSLIAFLIGALIAATLVLYDYCIREKCLIRFANDAYQFIANKIAFEEIRHFNPNRKGGRYIKTSGFVSFIFIAIGLGFGIWDILKITFPF